MKSHFLKKKKVGLFLREITLFLVMLHYHEIKELQFLREMTYKIKMKIIAFILLIESFFREISLFLICDVS